MSNVEFTWKRWETITQSCWKLGPQEQKENMPQYNWHCCSLNTSCYIFQTSNDILEQNEDAVLMILEMAAV